MRLLVTDSEKLEYFSSDPPPYAILSHRWRQEEVTFQDMHRPHVKSLHGYLKLSHACDVAKGLGFEYLWMDTCCIDKTSSSELSEAINSMYMWYRNAGMCFAYLDDVETGSLLLTLQGSEWFTRGWTLQELIAPAEVIFYTQSWSILDTRTNLASQIELITKVDYRVLLTGRVDDISVAKKMSWAANRKSARIEDEAYSLMGIFGVSMPTIYGEGRHAFVRLQEEIIRVSNDQSIFAWGELQRQWTHIVTLSAEISNNEQARRYTRPTPHLIGSQWQFGLLASAPSDFRHTEGITRTPLSVLRAVFGATVDLDVEFTLTNNGVRIRLPIELIDKNRNTYVAYLACQDVGSDGLHLLAIFLERLAPHQFVRISDTGTAALLRIPYKTILPSVIRANDWIYVVKDRQKSIKQRIRAGLKLNSLFTFCENFDFTLSRYTLVEGAIHFWRDSPSSEIFHFLDPSNSNPIPTYFLLEPRGIEPQGKEPSLLVVIAVDPSRYVRAEKNVFTVKIVRVLSHPDRPFHEVIRDCQTTEEHRQPSSVFATIDLTAGAKLILTLVCEKEPNWENLSEYNTSTYALLATISPIEVNFTRLFPESRPDNEWRELLSPEQFLVLRERRNEAPHSGKYANFQLYYAKHGTYACVACSNPLYQATRKLPSTLGWPAFSDAIAGAVTRLPRKRSSMTQTQPEEAITPTMRSLGMTGVEIVCSNCGSHLGQVYQMRDLQFMGMPHLIKYVNQVTEIHNVNSLSLKLDS